MQGLVLRPDIGPERGLDRRLLRTPERSKEQRLVWGRGQRPEQMLFRAMVQGLERRPLPTPKLTPERGPERTSLQEPEQRLQRTPDYGPLREGGLTLPYGGWAHGGNSKRKMQSAKWRKRLKENDLVATTNEERWTMYGSTTWDVTFWACGSSNISERNSMKKERSSNDRVRMTNAGAEPVDPVAEHIKRRVTRWKAKYTPERMAAILDAKSERMQERYEVQTEMLTHVEHRVSEVTDAAGVSKMMRIWYKDFGREVCRIWRTIPSSCQELEYDVIRYKWTARGLDPILLVKVKVAVIELLETSGFPRKDDGLLT